VILRPEGLSVQVFFLGLGGTFGHSEINTVCSPSARITQVMGLDPTIVMRASSGRILLRRLRGA